MKAVLTLIILLVSATSSASLKAEYQNWPKVGKATLTWGFWTVYHSSLKTPTGQYRPNQPPFALSIDYQMDIDKDDLLEETDKQWQHLKIDKQTRVRWLEQLKPIWPDVKENDNLTFVANQSGGVFYFNHNKVGRIDDVALARGFIDIWLSPDTKYPKLRKKLISANQK